MAHLHEKAVWMSGVRRVRSETRLQSILLYKQLLTQESHVVRVRFCS